jgi:hypothetical protein
MSSILLHLSHHFYDVIIPVKPIKNGRLCSLGRELSVLTLLGKVKIALSPYIFDQLF